VYVNTDTKLHDIVYVTLLFCHTFLCCLQVIFLSVESIRERSLISIIKVMNSNRLRYPSFQSCLFTVPFHNS